MSSFDKIRNAVQTTGLDKLEQSEKDIAATLNKLKPDEELSQTELLKLQQKLNSQANTLSMMSTIMKSMTDADKEVIRNC